MGCLLCLFFWIAAALAALKVWIKLTTGWCKSNVCLIGKTAIITGANAGIGYEAAVDFAKRGAKVILACRDVTRGQDAKDRIIKETDNPNIYFRKLDLSSLNSVREFAENINNTEERLDILVNNAGAGGLGVKKTTDGFELLMQVNYFGHFLLTNMLLDLMKKTPHSRIINVSSLMAKFCRNFDVNTLNQLQKKGINESRVYARSKLCNILFTIELAKRLIGTTVTTYSVHPGVVLTSIWRRMPSAMKYVVENIMGLFFKDSLEGAQTTIYCSIEKGIEQLSGHHFHDCNVVERYKTAQDLTLPSKLWTVSEELLNLHRN